MTPKAEPAIRVEYADLLEEEDDPGMVRLAQMLDAGYQLQRAPATLRSAPAGRRSRPYGRFDHAVAARKRTSWWSRQVLVRAGIAVAALCLLLASNGTLAGGNVTDLGKPTNDVPPAGTVGGFRHAGPFLRRGRVPELLFIGTYIEGDSAVERWPIVKALAQFGRFSNISATTSRPCLTRGNVLDCGTNPGHAGYPTFNWESARYTSRHVAFVHRDVIDRDLQARQRLQPTELALFNKYIRTDPSGTWQDAAFEVAIHGTAIYGGGPLPQRRFPLVSLDGYVEVGAQIAIVGDLTQKLNTFPTTFDTVQKSLQEGRAVGDAVPNLVSDINEETNIITALICRADGSQPGQVCSRAAIRHILKSVRRFRGLPQE